MAAALWQCVQARGIAMAALPALVAPPLLYTLHAPLLHLPRGAPPVPLHRALLIHTPHAAHATLHDLVPLHAPTAALLGGGVPATRRRAAVRVACDASGAPRPPAGWSCVTRAGACRHGRVAAFEAWRHRREGDGVRLRLLGANCYDYVGEVRAFLTGEGAGGVFGVGL